MQLTLNDLTSRAALGTLNSRAVLGEVYAKKFTDYLTKLNLVKDYADFSFAPAILRGYIYDKWIGDIIKDTPNLKVLNLGCGFCTRYFWIKNGLVEWTDADLPEIINLREGSGLHPADDVFHKHLILDANKMDLSLLSEYDLVIAEGLLCYFDKVKAMEIIAGCKHIICDVVGKERLLTLSSTQKWKYDYEEFKHLPITREFRYTYHSRDDRVLEFKRL